MKWGTISATRHLMGQQQSKTMASGKLSKQKRCTKRARCVPLPLSVSANFKLCCFLPFLCQNYFFLGGGVEGLAHWMCHTSP